MSTQAQCFALSSGPPGLFVLCFSIAMVIFNEFYFRKLSFLSYSFSNVSSDAKGFTSVIKEYSIFHVVNGLIFISQSHLAKWSYKSCFSSYSRSFSKIIFFIFILSTFYFIFLLQACSSTVIRAVINFRYSLMSTRGLTAFYFSYILCMVLRTHHVKQKVSRSFASVLPFIGQAGL